MFDVNFFLLLALLKTSAVILISLKDSWLIAFLNSTLTLLIFNKSKQTAFLVQQPFLFLVVLLFPILLVVLIILQLISSGLGYRSLIIRLLHGLIAGFYGGV